MGLHRARGRAAAGESLLSKSINILVGALGGVALPVAVPVGERAADAVEVRDEEADRVGVVVVETTTEVTVVVRVEWLTKPFTP